MGTYGLLASALDRARFVKTDRDLEVVVAWYGTDVFFVFDIQGVSLYNFAVRELDTNDWRDAREAIMVHLEEMREERMQ